ncbi:hypothetical protein ACFY93_29695 [Streptomyces sp. NPDC008313]|uniref:hypothetical protein n=1 Tax=Streptomyces sp. NPDC008313 TaxID=3364826 RepID=UPI0036E114CC
MARKPGSVTVALPRPAGTVYRVSAHSQDKKRHRAGGRVTTYRQVTARNAN